jgi:hypothetical protein
VLGDPSEKVACALVEALESVLARTRGAAPAAARWRARAHGRVLALAERVRRGAAEKHARCAAEAPLSATGMALKYARPTPVEKAVLALLRSALRPPLPQPAWDAGLEMLAALGRGARRGDEGARLCVADAALGELIEAYERAPRALRTSDLAATIADLVAAKERRDGGGAAYEGPRDADGAKERGPAGFTAEVHALQERLASLRERAAQREGTHGSVVALLGLARAALERAAAAVEAGGE